MKEITRTILAMAVVLLIGAAVFCGSVGAKSGELEPASDRVIFIKDPAEGYGNAELSGDGSGRNADNPLKLTLRKDYEPNAEKGKEYMQSLLYQATEALAETGGTIVICGNVALNDVSFEVHKMSLKLRSLETKQ